MRATMKTIVMPWLVGALVIIVAILASAKLDGWCFGDGSAIALRAISSDAGDSKVPQADMQEQCPEATPLDAAENMQPEPEPDAASAPSATPTPACGAIPFEVSLWTGIWWGIDSSDGTYWAVQENINDMRAAGGLPALSVDGDLSAVASARCRSFDSRFCAAMNLVFACALRIGEVLMRKRSKTDSGIRRGWLPETVAYMLREWKKGQDEQKEFPSEEYQDVDLVVILQNGCPCKVFSKCRILFESNEQNI